MKTPTPRVHKLLLALIVASVSTASLHAADLFWDATPGTPDGSSDGGAGSWDTSTANWDDGASYNIWNNINNDTAIFGGAAGAVDLGADVTVGGLTFSTGGYSITDVDGLNSITFGTAGNINASTGTTTITAVVAGTNKITKTGSGTLFLDAANTFSGGIDLFAGRLQIADGANEGTMLGASGNTLTFTGDAELYNLNGQATIGQSIQVNSGITATIGGAFGERTQVNGVVSGDGALVVQGYSAGFDVEFLNTANTFTGSIQINGSSGNASLGVRSLADSGSATTIGLKSSGNDGGQFEYMSGASSAAVFNNRQFVLTDDGNSGTNFGRQASIYNNAATANTLTVNTSLAITGTGNKNFVLGGSNTGDNAFNGSIIDALGSSTLSVYKQNGGKWILNGVNTYTGNTTVSGGTLVLGSSSETLFAIGAAGVNNQILGTATIELNGALVFDLTGASTTVSDSWNIVDVANLTETYGGTFSVESTLGAFTDTDGDLWTLAENGVLYEFQESTGLLSVGVIPEPSVALLSGLGLLLLLRHRKR